MSRKVPELLDAGGRARYQQALALKYMLLASKLRAAGHEAVAARLEASLAPLRDVPILALLQDGTPFFWQAVHRVDMALSGHSHETPDEVCGYLLACAFDAFFDHLQEGDRIAVGHLEGTLVLPRLGLEVPVEVTVERNLELSRAAVGEVCVRDAGGERVVSPRDPAVRLLDGNAEFAPIDLFSSAEPVLFTADCRRLVAPLADPEELASRLRQALRWIERVDPDTYRRLRGRMRGYVPLRSQDGRVDHAFSNSALPGIVFLSECDAGLHLAETLVHELQHNELYLLQEGETLFDESPGHVYYSPWRTDPRPLEGLFHALHVFTSLAHFYAAAEKADPEHARACRQRYRSIVHQVRLGLAQVRRERLRGVAIDIHAEMWVEADEHARALGLDPKASLDADLPALPHQHLQAWLEENPRLATSVRLQLRPPA